MTDEPDFFDVYMTAFGPVRAKDVGEDFAEKMLSIPRRRDGRLDMRRKGAKGAAQEFEDGINAIIDGWGGKKK